MVWHPCKETIWSEIGFQPKTLLVRFKATPMPTPHRLELSEGDEKQSLKDFGYEEESRSGTVII